ncbi:thiamine pyrophosphokinase [Pullulanibacillus pueri]|uniref:Thiamine diphosphokinase n=1 Tax=Pullulanibacillus pueri TaxID=1437324 RepID=A0A8J3EK05_9BACL|nr:thiamine diphosphokinase [Pullulanibacillus pueri]MBM7680188.1 thiamine pyrophosphokinase [Pullulanibacillus pueri]GGH74800.1 thiamine pyrophosphokinase [Pullulanibacillus pueri]
MEYVIFAGGPTSYLPDLNDPMFAQVQWIGVDRGTLHLLENGIIPLKAFGDFDSIDEMERQVITEKNIELHTFQPEKDKTDLEIALDWVLAQAPDRCFIIGATGGRLDHELMNIQMLVKYGSNKLLLMDRQNIVTLLNAGAYNMTKDTRYPYLSLVAFSRKITGITMEGFKYPLSNASLSWGESLCISNEFVQEHATISIEEGIAICIRSHD